MIPKIGDVVLTTFGVATVTNVVLSSGKIRGVVVKGEEKTQKKDEDENDGTDCFFQACLWRIPGKSIGSCSTAFLRSDTIIKELPVAPGMKTVWKKKQEEISMEEKKEPMEVMVYCYSKERNEYYVSSSSTSIQNDPSSTQKEKEGVLLNNNNNNNNFIWVSSSELEPSKCAKFYPLLVDLMQRGNQAASSASTFFQNNHHHLSSLMTEDTTTTTTTTTTTNQTTKSLAEAAATKIIQPAASSLPDAKEIQDIYKMLKDEELTVLLERGRERLQQLIAEDIPQTTLNVLKEAGIEIEMDNDDKHSSLEQSRKQALKALEDILSKNNVNVNALQQTMVEHFTTMVDSFASAAKSDATLNSIFETVNSKTMEWQEQTGRLLQTKSASLFLESSQRLQSRVEGLFKTQQWAEETRLLLTKAWTEGDVAITRLKSIELGDAIRSRLFEAIEIRSDTSGGLDGIIAGALTKVNNNNLGQTAIDQAQIMLAELQTSASAKTKDTNESLLAMISQKSTYRDTVLLRMEDVFCHLDSQLDDGITADEIASIASGEGGTAALLQPISKRAAKEIEKQLNHAEKSVTDPTILAVLAHVRNIVSGDMNPSHLMDELTSVLNDKTIVAAGENLAIEGERILDVIENASNNKIMNDVIVAVEKAGLTKENIMDQVHNLDIHKVLDTAETAITDEQKREELLSSATDSALDFLLCVLPSMPVPPLDGVKDGLLYHISNLSLEGFKVKKEDIFVDIAGVRTLQQQQQQQQQPTGNHDDFAGGNIHGSNNNNNNKSAKKGSTDVLVIDVQNISAILDRAAWNFEQTYFPYVKGNGEANVKLSDGHIKLKFELRKRPVATVVDDNDNVMDEKKVIWKPVLCLHERFCEIGEINLALEGEGTLQWIFNKLAALFKGPLRDYVVRTILNLMSDRSGWLLERLNGILENYWDLILKTANLTIDDLAEASEEDIIAATPDPYENEVDLVWRDHVPLGMNLLLNDDSGYIKVVDFPRGSQSRRVAIGANFDPDSFEGAIIVAVNGTRYLADDGEDLFDAMKDPSRPKTIRFKLSDQKDVAEMKDFISKSNLQETKKDSDNGNTLQNRPQSEPIKFTKVEIKESGPLGIVFSYSLDNFALMVQDIKSSDIHPSSNSERNITNLSKGLLLSHVNDHLVIGEGDGTKTAFSFLEKACLERPLSLTFIDPYHNLICFEQSLFYSKSGGPEELILEVQKLEGKPTKVFIKGFKNVDGMAEAEGAVIGDQLLFISGEPVGAACYSRQLNPLPFKHVMRFLQDPKYYPLALTFGRENQSTNRWTQMSTFDLDQAFTFCVTVNSFDELGCTLAEGSDLGTIFVKNFHDIKGPFQRQMRIEMNDQHLLGLAIESINGEVIPSYATSDIVTNVMKRRWTADKKIELLLCDIEKKKMIQDLVENS